MSTLKVVTSAMARVTNARKQASPVTVCERYFREWTIMPAAELGRKVDEGGADDKDQRDDRRDEEAAVDGGHPAAVTLARGHQEDARHRRDHANHRHDQGEHQAVI